MPDQIDLLGEELCVSKAHMKRCIRRAGWVAVVFNGSSHYRVKLDNPIRLWSMCLYNFVDMEDRLGYEETLKEKGYEETKEDLPLPFEYKVMDRSIAHPEPCDTDLWAVAFEYHMARKADQQEEQSKDCLQGRETADYLQ